MLMRSTDPFRDFDRLAQQLLGAGTTSRPAVMPMDAWRQGDTFVVEFDLPGVRPGDARHRRRAQRADGQGRALAGRTGTGRCWPPNDRPGCSAAQLVLGDNVDLEHVKADYESGVLRLTIPVAEKAKPRKIEVSTGRRPNGPRSRPDHPARPFAGASTMTTDPIRPSGARVAGATGAVTHGTPTQEPALESWVDLLLADEEWVRREFEDIVAAGWGGAVPPSPAPIQGTRWPRRPGHDDRPTPVHPPKQTHLDDHTQPCQRAPPD